MAKTSQRSVNDSPTVPSQFGGCAKPAQPYGSRIRYEKRKSRFATMSGKSSKLQISAAPVRQGKAEPDMEAIS